MSSRKRPPPTNGASSGVAIGSVDALLAKYARHLPPGGTITVNLVKGPTSRSVDPIAARRAAAKEEAARANSSGNDSDTGGAGGGNGAAGVGMTVPVTFPRIAKFNETVTPPDFVRGSLRDGRMYEEEVPKAKVSGEICIVRCIYHFVAILEEKPSRMICGKICLLHLQFSHRYPT